MRWIRPCRPPSSKGTAPGRGDPGHTSHPARRAVRRASGARTRFARYWGPFDSPVARAHDRGELKLLTLIIPSIAESLVRCRNSGVRAIPRVAAGAANDLATEFEGRSSADVADWRCTRIDARGRQRLCRVHAGPPKAVEGKMSVALLGLPLQILQGHHRGVSARSPRHPAARMRAAPAQVETLDGRAVGGPARDRSQGEQLVRRHVGLVDAASGQAPGPLHVERPYPFPLLDR